MLAQINDLRKPFELTFQNLDGRLGEGMGLLLLMADLE
jgi:hypothetical protein